MTLWAWKALWGEFVIEVIEIIPSKPTRIRGKIIRIIKPGYGNRKLQIGQIINIGIINVKPYTGQEPKPIALS